MHTLQTHQLQQQYNNIAASARTPRNTQNNIAVDYGTRTHWRLAPHPTTYRYILIDIIFSAFYVETETINSNADEVHQ